MLFTMVKQDGVLITLLCVLLSILIAEATEEIPPAAPETRSDVKNTVHARCTNCSVKGQLYDGHSRFQYDEGCNRYRCVCRCDGSWECPAIYIINICGPLALAREHRHSVSSSNASSPTLSLLLSTLPPSHRNDGRCRSCIINGKEHQGNSYFTYVEGCVTVENCICNCNGSWVCPQEGAKNTCIEESLVSSREVNRAVSWSVLPEKDQGLNNSTNSSSSSSSIDNNSFLNVSAENNNVTGRTEDLRQSYRGCQNCTAGGKVIKGNNYFELVEGCRKMNYCTCYCNGTWSCPERFVENICESDYPAAPTREAAGCRSCSVQGKTFPGNRYFQITDSCKEQKDCICYCDGSWNCPATGNLNKCVQEESQSVDIASRSRCKQCSIKGKFFPGNQYFHFTDGCTEYRNCICRCDGSWSCPDDDARNVCLDRSEAAVDTSSCSICEVYDSVFKGNQYFQIKRDCIEYRDCVCYCNGSWSCPDGSARNVCDREASLYLGLYGNGDRNSSRSRCTTCLAYGKFFKGSDYFDVIDGCTSYRKCICRCDGSWDCNNRFAVNICNNDTKRNTDSGNSVAETTDGKNITGVASVTQLADNQCSFCDARNKVVVGNSYFELTDGCVEYKNCLCRCDGSWECPPQLAKNVCSENNRTATSDTSLLTTCSKCVAKGKIVRGDSDFELIDGCTLYTSCRCSCNGKWECSEQKTQNICLKNATVNVDTCLMCQSSDGIAHPPNNWFRLTEDCIEHTCYCFCNGSWNCTGSENRWVCQDKCLHCDVEGRSIQNNTQFTHKSGCLEYTCICHCNGSWSCPDNTVRDTCQRDAKYGCSKCSMSSNEVYEGESDFVLEQGCVHYKCRCNCDGSYFCRGKHARNICRGEVLGGCRSCIVSETEIHKGETNFAMRRGCMFYDCKCNCDGSWHCPAEKARNGCLGEVPGGCRVCRVSESETYRASSFFHLRKGCINYKCKCNCDGGWSCPGKDARDVCKGEVPGGCKSCLISDNEYYPGASNFEVVRNCVRYKCRCNCDGSYNCPSQTATRICEAGAVTIAPICRTCRVSATEHFVGNSTFYLERDCSRYECSCKCDGSWECLPEKLLDICSRDRGRDASTSRCKSCRISKEVFPGNTAFKFHSGCFQFDCTCECSGRWSCDTKNPINVCREREQTVTERPLISDTSMARTVQDIIVTASSQVATQTSLSGTTFVEPDIHVQEVTSTPVSENVNRSGNSSNIDTDIIDSSNITGSNCRPCHADGRKIQVNEEFSLDRGCLQYKNCRCNCNGRWQCADMSNRCEDTQTSTVSQETLLRQIKALSSA